MASSRNEPHRIELRLRNINSLFNSMDPSPFQEKDLDADAEEFMVTWAQEHPTHVPLTLRVHLEERPEEDPTALIANAIQNYFAYRSKLLDREFKQLMKQARTSLFIGLAFLGTCLIVSRYLLPVDGNTFINFLRESLTIAGWVAMWRPMQLYLYDWWPVRRKGQLYQRLARMNIELEMEYR